MHSRKILAIALVTIADLPNLWVPLTLLGLIIIAAIFFARSK